MAKQGEKISYDFNAYRREVMSALCSTKLSGTDFRVILLILGQTDAYHRSVDTIKPAFFEERTGLDKSNVRRTIARLRNWYIVAKDKHFYSIRPPSEWDKAIFSPTQIRFKIEALSEEETPGNRIKSEAELAPVAGGNRVKIEAPTASKLKRPEVKSEAVLASSIENPSIENHLYNGSTSDTTGGKKLKPKQQEAGMFINWVSKYEKVPITSPNKLVALARQALVATEGTLEDVQDWYVWVKETDDFWGKKPPPMIIAKVGDMFPMFIRDRKEGKLHDARGKVPGAWREDDTHQRDSLETSRERGWRVTTSGPGETND